MINIPDPPVSQLVTFVWVHAAEVLQQMVEGMSGQVKSSTSLMCVKHVDDIQTKVPLEPLDVWIGTVKHLRRKNKQKK